MATVQNYEVRAIMDCFESLHDAMLRYKVGRLLKEAVNAYISDERPQEPRTKVFVQPIDMPLLSDEIEALKSGRKLEAIKLFKTRTGWSLLDAKRHIENCMH